MLRNFRLGGLGGGLVSTIRRPAVGAKPATSEFRREILTAGTGITFRAASYVAGQMNLATYYTVPAQEESTFGWGSDAFPDNQGYIYLQYQTVAPAAIDGVIQFLLEDAHGVAIAGGLVLEKHSTTLDGSVTDRRLKVPLPKYGLWASEDSRLSIRIDPSATATSTLADSTLGVPFTSRRPS